MDRNESEVLGGQKITEYSAKNLSFQRHTTGLKYFKIVQQLCDILGIRKAPQKNPAVCSCSCGLT